MCNGRRAYNGLSHQNSSMARLGCCQSSALQRTNTGRVSSAQLAVSSPACRRASSTPRSQASQALRGRMVTLASVRRMATSSGEGEVTRQQQPQAAANGKFDVAADAGH